MNDLLSNSTKQPKSALSLSAFAMAASLLCASLFTSTGAAQQKAPAPHSTDFTEAQGLLQQGRLHEARTAVEDELRKHPNSVEGYDLLGIINGDLKDYPAALDAFKRALEISPTSIKTNNNLASLLFAMRQYDLAEKQFRNVLRVEPSNRDANYNLGVLLMMKGATAEAIPHFERVRPPSTESQFNLIRAYFEAKRPGEALKLAASLSSANKGDIKVHFSLGSLLASQKQYKPAQAEFERADALQPETFEVIYNLGQAYLRAGDDAKADLALNRALKQKPDSVDAQYLLAQAYKDEARPLDALDLLIRAHKTAPENVDVIFLMAQISMSQDYYEDAIPLLESGLKIAPQRTDLLAALGQSYFMAGKVDKAIEQFKKLLEIDHSARSLAFLGLSYRNLGRFDEAKGYFEQGLKLDPRCVSCLYNMGYIAERQGDAATAEKHFQDSLRLKPDLADALLELANMRMAAKHYDAAEVLLRKFVRVSKSPATGYYKLSMTERSLHETEAADRDLNSFKALSKSAPTGPLPFEHLFDYLNDRAAMSSAARQQLDITELNAEIKRHPDQPQVYYLLAEADLKAGKVDDAKAAIAALDKLSAGDFRSLTGTGVLLARYRLYDDAITHFQQALEVSGNSDDTIFDLANAYFHRHMYAQSLEAAQHVSEAGRKDDAYRGLLGDIYSHLGKAEEAAEIYNDEIRRNPDDDQPYLSLALLNLRSGKIAEANQILEKGQSRIPRSGKLNWGLGLTAALADNSKEATVRFEHAVDLMPEWSGAYSVLGVFYFETGHAIQAREVLDRFKSSSANASLDIDRIEKVLDNAPATTQKAENEPMSAADKTQFLQFALSLADRTL
jgi:tetratricopeptide (TPR) repeat protein